MDFTQIVTVLIIPAFTALAGVVAYLWKAHAALQKDLIKQKDGYIKLLEKEQIEMEVKLDDFRERLRQAERDLYAVQQNLQLMQASNTSLPLPSWTKDREGNVLSANPAYEKIFLIPRGFRLSQFVGYRDSHVWPDHVAASFKKHDDIVLATGEVLDTIEQVTAPDGNDYPCRVIKFPRRAGNLIVGVDGIAIPAHLVPWEG